MGSWLGSKDRWSNRYGSPQAMVSRRAMALSRAILLPCCRRTHGPAQDIHTWVGTSYGVAACHEVENSASTDYELKMGPPGNTTLGGRNFASRAAGPRERARARCLTSLRARTHARRSLVHATCARQSARARARPRHHLSRRLRRIRARTRARARHQVHQQREAAVDRHTSPPPKRAEIPSETPTKTWGRSKPCGRRMR